MYHTNVVVHNNGTVALQHMLTDDELFRVAAEITKVLEDKWTALQEPLDIPDDIMLNVLSHRNTGQQVRR